MVDFREVSALKKDPVRARNLARGLKAIEDIEWSDWERDFIDGRASASTDQELSTRQAEKLVEIIEESVWIEKVDGLSLRLIFSEVWLARCDVSEESMPFLLRMEEHRKQTLGAGAAFKLRRRDARVLLSIARGLGGIVEPYAGRSLDRLETVPI